MARSLWQGKGLTLGIVAACSAGLLGGLLPAQDSVDPQPLPPTVSRVPQIAPSDMPATIRTARLSYFEGAVEIGRVDTTVGGEPVTNMPLTEGTRVATGDYGQVEIEFEDGSVVRLTPRSTLTLNQLGIEGATARTELELLAGLAYFELRKAPGSSYTVDAGGTRLIPLENTTVRIGLDNPPAAFAVLTGSAEVERTGDFTAEVHAGESLRGIADEGKPFFRTNLIVPESWDAWNATRDESASDQADQRTTVRDRFAGDGGYGWSELDTHGSWYDVPGAGPVWQPENADDGFDPYGFGNWVYVNTSYVWASGYSWGWTPFHCGAWQYFSGFGWGWTPNSGCGRLGFGGGLGGVFLLGRHPGRFPPVVQPKPGPVHPRPLVPVRGPDGPRPPFRRGGEALIAGHPVAPLPAVARSSSRSESAVGGALLRDFPVNVRTHQPVLGSMDSGPGLRGSSVLNGSVPVRNSGGGRALYTPGAPGGTVPGTLPRGTSLPASSVSRPAAPPMQLHPAPSMPVYSAPPPVRTALPPPPVHIPPPPPAAPRQSDYVRRPR